MSISNAECKVLVLTIGTGNTDNLENSLYAPLAKSIDTGSWDRIVLLPSQRTVEQANEMRRRITKLSAEVCPIPGAGSENDADASFAHFDKILGEIIESDGAAPKAITLDFTRGTKAMSAALVLAGVARGIPALRYIEGKRGKRGSVVAETEVIKEVRTVVASARQLINLAERLMLRGDFEAVRTMHAEMSSALEKLPEQLHSRLNAYAHVAAIYAAWDRFDYCHACGLLSDHRETVSAAGQFKPTPDMEQWMGRLAAHPDRDKHEERAAYLRYLACDLLANAERRYRDGLFEDAGLRWYRLLELIGQARLFDHGYDSGRLPGNDPKVKGFNDKLRKGNSSPLASRPKIEGILLASRLQTARFLKYLGDSLATRLLHEDNKDYVKARNDGLLAHGFDAQASQLTPERIRSVIENFEQLLCEDRHEAREWLAVARSLDFRNLIET
ncbi:MAG: TIGR02710 family CRISPR-associated CARF protein [Bacteroidetes bacterium]|nr:TIGR02710 family CRISPR-associated CARF protein [Bacteroidota bacterium]